MHKTAEMMKASWRVALALVLALGVGAALGGCTGSDDEEDEGSAVETEATEETEEATDETDEATDEEAEEEEEVDLGTVTIGDTEAVLYLEMDNATGVDVASVAVREAVETVSADMDDEGFEEYALSDDAWLDGQAAELYCADDSVAYDVQLTLSDGQVLVLHSVDPQPYVTGEVAIDEDSGLAYVTYYDDHDVKVLSTLEDEQAIQDEKDA